MLVTKNPCFCNSAHWHGEINLETIFGGHVVLFLYILVKGYLQVSFQAKVVEVDSSCIYGNLEVELDDIRPMDIFGDALDLLTYKLGSCMWD
jgi:hypothetical protein